MTKGASGVQIDGRGCMWRKLLRQLQAQLVPRFDALVRPLQSTMVRHSDRD